MPYSPFTRFLACVLVVLAALALLWPDERALEWAWHGAGGMAVLLAIFTWSAVKNAAPLDDRAFQHCLPDGPNRAFFRIVWIHVLVLAGVSFAVLVYCARWNFGWRAMSWGVVMLTVPAWALMSAVGVASSAGTSQQHWKSAGWLAVFLPPVVSGLLLYWVDEMREAYVPEVAYFTPLRTVVLTAAVLYPLVWWLIAARKHRGLGLMLGGATGALLPWLIVYGDFVKDAREQLPRATFPAASTHADQLTVSGKSFPGGDVDNVVVKDVITIDGLADGEFTRVNLEVRRGEEDVSLTPLEITETISEELARWAGHTTERGTPIAYRHEGKMIWGNEGLNWSMRDLLPPVETFFHWNWRGFIESPGTRLMIPNPVRWVSGDNPNPPKMSLSVSVANPMSWELLGSCLATEGASFRLDGGRTLQLLPMSQREDGKAGIMIRRYQESLWQAQGPWFGDSDLGDRWSQYDLALVAIDETGKHARVLDDFRIPEGYDQANKKGIEKVMLGEYHYRLVLTDGGYREGVDVEEVEFLRKSRLYVLTSRLPSSIKVVELPVVE